MIQYAIDRRDDLGRSLALTPFADAPNAFDVTDLGQSNADALTSRLREILERPRCLGHHGIILQRHDGLHEPQRNKDTMRRYRDKKQQEINLHNTKHTSQTRNNYYCLSCDGGSINAAALRLWNHGVLQHNKLMQSKTKTIKSSDNCVQA